MNELIKIDLQDLNGATVPTCNARDLHAFLEVGKDFSTWIKERIEQYGFVQGADYQVFTNSGENPQGGRPAKEYAITTDMAKELSMVERNEKGKQARQYFIECDNRLRQIGASPATKPATLNPPKVFPDYFKVARLIGLDRNAAAIAANQAVRKLTGANVLKLLDREHLEAEQQQQVFTPTELGKKAEVSAMKFNQLLAEAGMQKRVGDKWVPTEAAEGFYRLFDTGKSHGSGAPVQQLKWFDNVLNLIKVPPKNPTIV